MDMVSHDLLFLFDRGFTDFCWVSFFQCAFDLAAGSSPLILPLPQQTTRERIGKNSLKYLPVHLSAESSYEHQGAGESSQAEKIRAYARQISWKAVGGLPPTLQQIR